MGQTQDVHAAEMTEEQLETAIEGTEAPAGEEADVGNLKSEMETLRGELAKTQEKLSRQMKANETNQSFIQRQATEIGELRKQRESLDEEEKVLNATDPTDQMVNDPAGFRDHAAKQMDINRRKQELVQQEHQLKVQAFAEKQKRMLVGTEESPGPAHDLEDNMDTIESILKDANDDPVRIAEFRSNPFMFPAGFVNSLNAQARLFKEVTALKEENEKLKGKSDTVLENIEKTARKPLANQPSSQKKDTTDVDVTQLSDSELNKLLGA